MGLFGKKELTQGLLLLNFEAAGERGVVAYTLDQGSSGRQWQAVPMQLMTKDDVQSLSPNAGPQEATGIMVGNVIKHVRARSIPSLEAGEAQITLDRSDGTLRVKAMVAVAFLESEWRKVKRG